jgi:predicted dehydrogenase
VRAVRRKLRLGLLGTGIAARKLYVPAFARLEDRIEVVACASRRRESAAAFARLAGVPTVASSARQLLTRPDVDAIFISLPIAVQPRFVLEALAAGKPVISEKPIAPDPAAGKKLLRAAGRFSTPWMIAENYAFLPEAERVKRWVERGRLGRVRLVEARQTAWLDRRNPYVRTAWRARPRHLGGFVLDGGVHLAHLVRRLFGMPVELGAITAAFDPALPPIDTAVAALRFAGGAVGTWTSCFTARDDGPLLRVLGSRANAELHRDRAVLRQPSGRETVFRSGVDSYEAQLRHFAGVVLDGAPLAYSPTDALADLTLIAAVCGHGTGRDIASRGRRRRKP